MTRIAPLRQNGCHMVCGECEGEGHDEDGEPCSFCVGGGTVPPCGVCKDDEEEKMSIGVTWFLCSKAACKTRLSLSADAHNAVFRAATLAEAAAALRALADQLEKT